MDKMDPEKALEEIKARRQKIWESKDIKSMALECIDSICIHIEDGMSTENGLELIYKFAHAACDSICKESHDNWRDEIRLFYYEEFIRLYENEVKEKSLQQEA